MQEQESVLKVLSSVFHHECNLATNFILFGKDLRKYKEFQNCANFLGYATWVSKINTIAEMTSELLQIYIRILKDYNWVPKKWK